MVYVCTIDGGEDMENVIVEAFRKYVISNPLHPDAFPAVRKMEAEVVQMCLRMYNNPDGAGTMTSGGTESIIMSVKTHRDWARAVKGITEPELSVSRARAMMLYTNIFVFLGSYRPQRTLRSIRRLNI